MRTIDRLREKVTEILRMRYEYFFSRIAVEESREEIHTRKEFREARGVTRGREVSGGAVLITLLRSQLSLGSNAVVCTGRITYDLYSVRM